MPLPADFVVILSLLGQVFEEYQSLSGSRAILVGGAAVSLFTKGAYISGDLDVLAGISDAFDLALTTHGFRKEDRKGGLIKGYYHPSHPRYGIDWVSGAYFDGMADPGRVRAVVMAPGSKLNVAPVEGLIADRLAQYAQAPRDMRPLKQAKLLKRLGGKLDMVYLAKRLADEGGDIALIGGANLDRTKDVGG
jgi:hypothetical protein